MHEWEVIEAQKILLWGGEERRTVGSQFFQSKMLFLVLPDAIISFDRDGQFSVHLHHDAEKNQFGYKRRIKREVEAH